MRIDTLPEMAQKNMLIKVGPFLLFVQGYLVAREQPAKIDKD